MSITDEEFRAKLEKHFTFYRINLRSPLLSNITYDQWYRVDILLVNELGLFRRKDIEPNGQVEIDCHLYCRSDTGTMSLCKDSKVAVRPTRPFVQGQLDAHKASVAGFERSGKGAFEYCISSSPGLACTPGTHQQLYLYIYVKQSVHFTTSNNILPLMIGPIHLSSRNGTGANSTTISSETLNPPYDTTLPLELLPNVPQDHMVYDGYRLFSPTPENHVVIHEMWDTGIPGKIWDSALVMLDFIKLMIEHHPDYIQDKHVVDLSAGTGLLGLYTAFSDAKPHKVTITELEEAIDLINKNTVANYPPESQPPTVVEVKTLLWGNEKEAAACGKADLILASDVLYEAQFFKDLVEALADLSHDKTRIYIGYKRRGLTVQEEEEFWGLCNDHGFTVDLLKLKSGDGSDNEVDDVLVPTITRETGVQIYRLSRQQK
ncbi:putative methyltransferase-domain-containing protein [Mycotypha africana]|uniref:putative methyltransferase-domain-containing protein n=1 Tax=Mycotypha africana TaxID=64632 RepID=UPI002301CF55|nr:putative methyltransferase-domain-containing protein [Mycotypha africana]KAI8968249.1 putative methyltransferase-domain-containing protein [Mycotypha africana]